MRLRRLTGLERDKIEEEYSELMKLIDYLNSILASEEKLLGVIKDELLEIKAKYNDERKTQIEKVVNDIDIEDLIQEEETVITLTNSGYIKRISADTYSAQRRGGMTTKEDDFVEHVLVTSTHSDVLFFTNRGRVYKKRAYEIPDAGRTAKGTNIINLIQIEQDEKIETVLTVRDNIHDGYLFMATKHGLVKKTPLSEFKNLRKSGLIAINLREGDELLKVKVTRGDADIIIVSQEGNAIKFNEQDVRPMGRTASGVKSINLKDDIVVSGCLFNKNDEYIAVFTNKGTAKRIKLEEMEKSSRARRGLLLIREVKTNPYKIVKTFVINGKSKLGFMTSSDIDYIRSAEISINDRYSTGSSISKKKVLDVFEVKELISKEELEVLEEEEVESIPKKDVSLKEIDDKIMTIDDFLDDFNMEN